PGHEQILKDSGPRSPGRNLSHLSRDLSAHSLSFRCGHTDTTHLDGAARPTRQRSQAGAIHGSDVFEGNRKKRIRREAVSEVSSKSAFGLEKNPDADHERITPWCLGEIRPWPSRSEEHTSELQSPYDLVC